MQKRKLTAEQVLEIKELAKTDMKKADIARRYGISPQLVSTIVRYGYNQRPPSKSRAKVIDDFTSWAALAKSYNLRYPDDPPLTATEAKNIHDIALNKIRMRWGSEGRTLGNMI